MKTLLTFLSILLMTPLSPSLNAEIIDVYFASGGKTDGIHRAKFNTATGKIKNQTVASDITSVGFMAWHPNKTMLYAIGKWGKESCVTGYKVNPDGSLTEFTRTPSLDGHSAHISVHPSGNFLITAQYRSGSTALYTLSSSGEFKESKLFKHEDPSKVTKRQEGNHPHWSGFSPDGRYAFIPDLGSDKIHIYKVSDDKNSMEPHGFATSQPGAGPRHMRFSTNGKYIYLLNELNLTITTFLYDSNRGIADSIHITETLPSDIKEQEVMNSAAEILTHPSGQFIYSSNRGNDSISVFQVYPQDGSLQRVEIEPVRGAWPRNINIDPTGQWILAAGQHSNSITVFSIDQEEGTLTHQMKSAISIPQPLCILFAE